MGGRRYFALAVMHILYNKPNKLENHKSSYPIYYVPLIKLALQFNSWDFDILNYEIFINKFQIVQEFQYSVVSSFIDSGAGLVLSIWFVLAVASIEQRKQLQS